MIVTLLQERFASRAQVRLEAERMQRTLSEFPRQRGIEPRYSNSDRKLMDQLGQSGAAWSYLVHLETLEDVQSLKRWIEQRQERTDTSSMPPVLVEHRASTL